MHRVKRTNLSAPPTRAVVLAAGRGRRLIPYTNRTPKPLLPVAGRPVLDYVLTALAAAGVQQVTLVVGYRSAQIRQYAGDGAAWKLALSYARQEERLGTAHALQQAAGFLSAPSFVLAADYALPPGYLAGLKAAYRAAGTPLAVSLKRLPAGELAARSSVRFDDAGRICAIVEKPPPGAAPSTIGASLIYIVPPVIRRYLDHLARSSRGEYELPAVVNRMLADGYAIAGLLQPAPPEWAPPE
jgi:NDP-sugar pyrophosphorylase family protein